MTDKFTVDDLGGEFYDETATRADVPAYHILFIADFAGSEQAALSGVINDQVLPVTAESFDALVGAAGPTLALKIADPVKGGGGWADITLRFESLRDFDPAQLIGRIPATQGLAGAREQFVARLRGKITADALSASVRQAVNTDAALHWISDALQQRPSTAAQASPDAVDSLLSQIDLGEGDAASPPSRPRTAFGAAVSAVAGAAGIPADEASAIRRAVAEIDRRLSLWLTAVLHAPPLQAMESAWRSLAFLVRKMEFRKNLRLSVLHAPRAVLAERIRRLVIDPVFDEGAATPDLIAVNSVFANTAADVEVLDELAQHAASLPAVVVAGVGAEFFGAKFAWQVPTLPPLVNHFDQWQFAKWRGLRDQMYARSLGVVFGRCLLRPSHGPLEGRDLEFQYREPIAGEHELIWAPGVLAAACSIARSVAEMGWPTRMAGHPFGAVDGFATAALGQDGGKTAGPTDTHMPLSKVQELGKVGVNAVVALKADQEATFWNGLSAARPEKIDQEGMLEISLPYQLFAARLGSLLIGLKPELSGLSPEGLEARVRDRLVAWLSEAGGPDVANLITVLTRTPEGDPAGLEFAASIVPPPSILPGGVPMVLGYRVR